MAGEARTQADQAVSNTSPVTLIPQTKFMQNYRIASAANAGTEVVSIANGNGDVELFTVGSDGKIWNFYPDPASDTGYGSVSTGLTGTAIAAGVDGSGHIVIFSAQGLVIGYVAETAASGPSRWSAPATCTVPLPSGAQSIAKIDTMEVGGHLLVGALIGATGPLQQTLYHFVYSDWPSNGSAPVFSATVVTINTLNCVWTGLTYANAAYTVLDTIILQFTISTQQLTRPPLAGTFSSIDVDSVVDSTGNNQTFAILNDGNAYHLVGGGSVPLSWAQLTTSQSYKQVRTVLDASGAAHVFMLSTSNRVYHLEPSAQQIGGYLEPAQIFGNTVQLGVATNAGGEIDLFAIGTAQNVITHLFQEEASGNWANQRLEVATNGQVEDYASYTTDVQVVDSAGAPLANTPVNVWASEEARITVNGSTYFTGPKRPASVNTNDVAVVSLAQEVGSLSAPTILISVPSLMSPGESVAVEQSADVQARLHTTTGDDLMAANGANGQPILTGSYRTQETAEAVAGAVNQCMSIAVSSIKASPSLRALHAKRMSPGASHYTGDPARATLIHLPAVPIQHWQIAFDGPNARFRMLSAEEAQALLAEKRASLPKPMGMFDWLEDVGDFIEGVAQDIVSVVDTVITTVSDGIQAAITFVVDGVTYLFETIVSAIEQAIDLAELVFAKVKIFFEQLYEWLAFLFNWGDILRTHEALAYAINQLLGFLGGATAGMQTIFDSGITTLQANLQAWFQNAIQNIAGTQSLGGYSDNNEQQSPQFSSATSNNIVYNHVIDNSSSSSSLTLLVREGAANGPFDQFLQQLQSLIDLTKSSAAFDRALTYFNNLGGSPDQIFSQALAGLMSIAEGVLQAMLSGVKAIVDALLQLVQALIGVLQNSLNEEWDIPFVTTFYHWLTDGAPLSTLDIVALIAAIPTTILYKAIYGSAPFADQGSVDAFKASFNAQSMLAASGLGPKTEVVAQPILSLDAPAWTGMLSKQHATLVAVGGVVCGFFNSAFAGVLDICNPADQPSRVLTYAGFIFESASQICAFPWFITSGAPNCDDADGTAKILWIVQNAGILLDGVYIYKDHVMPENDQDPGVIVAFCYSMLHLTAVLAASLGQSGLPVAVNVLPVIPEITKLLRLTSVVAATETTSLKVQAGIDVVVGWTGAVCSFVLVLQQINANSPQPELQRFLAAEIAMGDTTCC